MNRLTAVENPPGLPADADEQMGRVMADIAVAMHQRLDEAMGLAAHPFHAELRDWATRLGGCGAGCLPARERMGLAPSTTTATVA